MRPTAAARPSCLRRYWMWLIVMILPYAIWVGYRDYISQSVFNTPQFALTVQADRQQYTGGLTLSTGTYTLEATLTAGHAVLQRVVINGREGDEHCDLLLSKSAGEERDRRIAAAQRANDEAIKQQDRGEPVTTPPPLIDSPFPRGDATNFNDDGAVLNTGDKWSQSIACGDSIVTVRLYTDQGDVEYRFNQSN